MIIKPSTPITYNCAKTEGFTRLKPEEQQKMIADNRQFIERFKGTYSKDQPGKFA
jgi:hypothetical protein